MRRHSTNRALAGCAILFSVTTAVAQESRVAPSNGDGLDTHLFRPALDSKGFFTVNGADIIGKNDVSFGLVMDYGRTLMRLEEGHGTGQLVSHSFQGTFGFNYGLFNVANIGFSAPATLITGEEATNIGPASNTYNAGKLDVQTLSTVALHAKVRLLRPEKGIGASVALQGGLPLAESTSRGLGADPTAWFWPRAQVEGRIGNKGQFRLGGDVGYRFHSGNNPKFDQLAEGKFEYGNLITGGLGASLRALPELDLVAETYMTHLASGNSDSKQKLSAEAVGGAKVFVEKRSFLMLGAGSRYTPGFQAANLRLFLGFVFEPSIGDRDGDGIKDDEDQCPDEPEDFDGFEDQDGCPDPDNDKDGIPDDQDECPDVPEDKDGEEDEDGCPEGGDGDRDGDGILDSVDQCPDVPEDKDGFEDEDGCPEDDNDQDGIPDKRDNCPNEPETFNAYQDDDGCPDKGKVVVEDNEILILEKVMFETNSAKILPQSFELLDGVATTLVHHPEFTLVEVGGHADERSNDLHNLQLTKARAAAVREALIARKVESGRLRSVGYGEYCPLDPSHTPEAWDKNRRVEFKVLETKDGKTDVEVGCERARQQGIK